jgi:predicted DNA-binding antitoxin AbrB/MazE fold protein
MAKVTEGVFSTEAVFSQGVLKPVDPLQLREQQRVRLIIEPIGAGEDIDRAAALSRLRAGIASMAFSSSGPLPAREELHDRS